MLIVVILMSQIFSVLNKDLVFYAELKVFKAAQRSKTLITSEQKLLVSNVIS